MFDKVVCYISRPNIHAWAFSIERGNKVVCEGITYDNYDGLVKILKRRTHRRKPKIVRIDKAPGTMIDSSL